MSKTPEEQAKLLERFEKFLDKFEAEEEKDVEKIPVKEPELKEPEKQKSGGIFAWLFGD